MNVKVCDMGSESFKEDFIGSLTNTGFAVLTNHGVSHELIKTVQSDWRNFFIGRQEYKDRFVNGVDDNMGYKGLKTEKALGAKSADLKEFFHWHPGHRIPLELFQSTWSLYSALDMIAQDALFVIDSNEAANTRRSHIGYRDGKTFESSTLAKACSNSEKTILRSLYYPAMDFSKESDAVRAAAHEDINMITLLVASTASGLQVKDNEGKWHDVPHEENSIVVNVGDMLQLATDGRYKSTTHRVINPENNTSDRISLPMFIHPHPEILLAPGIDARKFLEERIKQIYMKVTNAK